MAISGKYSYDERKIAKRINNLSAHILYYKKIKILNDKQRQKMIEIQDQILHNKRLIDDKYGRSKKWRNRRKKYL